MAGNTHKPDCIGGYSCEADCGRADEVQERLDRQRAAPSPAFAAALDEFGKVHFFLGQWNSKEHTHIYLDELDARQDAARAEVLRLHQEEVDNAKG